MIEPLTYKRLFVDAKLGRPPQRYQIINAHYWENEECFHLIILDPEDGLEKSMEVHKSGIQAMKRIYILMAMWCQRHGQSVGNLECLEGCFIVNDPLQEGMPYLKFQGRG